MRLKSWEDKAENIIVQTSAYQLANTSTAHIFLHPISTILANFLEEETDFILVEEIEKLRKTERYYQWMHLLEDLQLVRREENGYKYGNMFTELRRQVEDDQQFLTHVLAYVIRERYPVLKEVFQLKQFETLVHLDSCYYRPALEARKVLFQRAESLYNRYVADYKYRSRFMLPIVLFELCKSQALKQKDEYYFANDELFEKMLKISEKFIPLSSPIT
jgi:phage anti-repressor protein